MIIELLTEETHRISPRRRTLDGEYWKLHCSPSFAEALKKDFLRSGFIINIDRGQNINFEDAQPTGYMIPMIGRIDVLEDMEQGYRIEKIENQINTKE